MLHSTKHFALPGMTSKNYRIRGLTESRGIQTPHEVVSHSGLNYVSKERSQNHNCLSGHSINSI